MDNQSKDEKKFCQHCGAEVFEGDKHCGKCGKKIDSKEVIKIKFNHLISIIVIIFIAIIVIASI